MGLILDTNILIAAERSRKPVSVVTDELRFVYGDMEIALSAISVVELTHGIYRARTEQQRAARQAYIEEIFAYFPIHPVSIPIAQLAGQIEGQKASEGIIIPFQDLLIAATALHSGDAVLTRNTRHFLLVPGLRVMAML